jgi:hypothetical protein
VDSEINYIGLLFFCLILGFAAYRLSKFDGIRGAIMGAKIKSTIGEVEGASGRIGTTIVRVHKLDGPSPEKQVGIELVVKSIIGYQMMPIAISAAKAKELVKLIESASK